ncbi:hypothetical protein [Atlantibacter sp. RC6]|uniref:hypothetical protein n=1 Tax=Atlantibacter sp. RC6 TaxID=2587036 RepID=UPI00160610A9|nr:hypothetical protein [Atlantibacter sp. RC6]MBB3322185.1 hypothetical protein [Atlantibacter sp. RC6]
MSNSELQKPFDIHQKLRSNASRWGYLHAAEPWQGDCNFQLITDLSGEECEYALYQRVEGDYFCLVDFFKNYNEACEEAKNIINSNPKYKAAINY